jgi:signal transduction histidine kinase
VPVRLGVKMVFATLVALVVLGVVTAWSLGAVNRLVAANRTIVRNTLPALRQEAELTAQAARLVRLQTRWSVVHQPEYEDLWARGADAFRDDLEALSAVLMSPDEQRLHRKAAAAYRTYRRLASEVRDGQTRLLRPAGAAAQALRRAGEHLYRMLEQLAGATTLEAAAMQARAAELEERTWRAVVVVLPLGALVSLLLSSVIALRTTRVLSHLAAASSRVAQGAFAERVPAAAADEVGDVARAFNSMAARLGELDRIKEQLFAHVSHEVRTPLTSIREATNLLADRVPGPLEPRQARLVEIIADSSDRLLRLVDRILDLSRLRAGLSPMERRPVRMQSVTARAVTELRPQAEAAHVALVRNGEDVWVQGDEERLLEVLVNLLSNAIRAADGGGTVRVGLDRDGEAGVVSVADDGVGIAPDALPRIFDPYVQAPGARGGTGLGLAIVKSIVEAHGGRIEADSRPGHGSRFRIWLPATEAVPCP